MEQSACHLNDLYSVPSLEKGGKCLLPNQSLELHIITYIKQLVYSRQSINISYINAV